MRRQAMTSNDKCRETSKAPPKNGGAFDGSGYSALALGKFVCHDIKQMNRIQLQIGA